MAQTSYSFEHLAGFEGDPASSEPHHIRAMRNNMATDLPYGRAVVHDLNAVTSQFSARLPSAFSDKIVGLSANDRSHVQNPSDGFGVDGVAPNDLFNVMFRGDLYVVPEQAVNPTVDVYVRIGPGTATAGTTDSAGKFRIDADAHVAWAASTVVALDVRRVAVTRVYKVITAGTTGATAPTGTGSDVTDGTAHWAYIGVAAASTLASCVLLPQARWKSSVAAGAIAALDINLP